MSLNRNRFRIQLACATLAITCSAVNAQETVPVVPAPQSSRSIKRAVNLLRPAPDFQPQWVWSTSPADTLITLEFEFTLDSLPSAAELQIAVDNEYSSLAINNRELGSGNDWTKPKSYPILSDLVTGANKVSLKGVNLGGDAGAIVAIRLKYGDEIRLVGTSRFTSAKKPTGEALEVATVPPNSPPWNLVRQETERLRFVRSEARRLQAELNGLDVHRAARAMGILAQLALEFSSLEVNGPTVTLVNPPAVRPVTLSTQVINTVIAQLSDSQKIKQQAASAAVTLLTAKVRDLTTLLNLMQPVVCAPQDVNVDAQLAVLSGIRQRLDTDNAAYAKLLDDFKKAREEKRATVEQAAADVETKEDEVAKVKKQLDALGAKKASTELRIAVINAEITSLQQEIATLPDGDPRKSELSDQVKQKQVVKKALDDQKAALEKQSETQNLKFLQLQDELDDLKSTLAKLANELAALIDPVVPDELLARLTAIEKFLEEVSKCNSSMCVDGQGTPSVVGKLAIVASLELQLREAARALRYKYSSIKSLDQAEAFFATTNSTGAVPAIELGAATSAADRPTAADVFTSADRASVSSTAPYDPNSRPQSPPRFPLTDYRGQRLQSDTSMDQQNVVRKAPGATPAEKAK